MLDNKEQGTGQESKKMKTLQALWKFAQGKKTGFTNAIQLLLWYLYSKGCIGLNEAILISGILAGFGITANVSNAVTRARDKANANISTLPKGGSDATH